jgi:hypothetical protein
MDGTLVGMKHQQEILTWNAAKKHFLRKLVFIFCFFFHFMKEPDLNPVMEPDPESEPDALRSCSAKAKNCCSCRFGSGSGSTILNKYWPRY